MTGTNCDLFTHNQSQSYLNHLVYHGQQKEIGTLLANCSKLNLKYNLKKSKLMVFKEGIN
jgi:hypothetical protein